MTNETKAMVAQIKTLFGSRETITWQAARKLLALLDQAPMDALVLLVREKVKFCHGPARLRLIGKFGMPRIQANNL